MLFLRPFTVRSQFADARPVRTPPSSPRLGTKRAILILRTRSCHFKRGRPMNDRHEPEKWRVLCELASREQDSSKLISLISEINRALDESLNLKMRRVCATPATQ